MTVFSLSLSHPFIDFEPELCFPTILCRVFAMVEMPSPSFDELDGAVTRRLLQQYLGRRELQPRAVSTCFAKFETVTNLQNATFSCNNIPHVFNVFKIMIAQLTQFC